MSTNEAQPIPGSPEFAHIAEGIKKIHEIRARAAELLGGHETVGGLTVGEVEGDELARQITSLSNKHFGGEKLDEINTALHVLSAEELLAAFDALGTLREDCILEFRKHLKVKGLLYATRTVEVIDSILQEILIRLEVNFYAIRWGIFDPFDPRGIYTSPAQGTLIKTIHLEGENKDSIGIEFLNRMHPNTRIPGLTPLMTDSYSLETNRWLLNREDLTAIKLFLAPISGLKNLIPPPVF